MYSRGSWRVLDQMQKICGKQTFHGFRSMASALLNEMGYNSDWIERQLAHCERNSVRAAYNYAQYLPERRRMLQEYADYLDGLREQADKKNQSTNIFYLPFMSITPATVPRLMDVNVSDGASEHKQTGEMQKAGKAFRHSTKSLSLYRESEGPPD